MKKIILVRHAKSDWSITGIKDIERPLNQRGYDSAHIMGAKLAGKTDGSVVFISSPAIRAISTSMIFADETGYNKDAIKIVTELYEADEENYLKVLRGIENKFDTAVIFGHNPTISNMVGQLTGEEIVDQPTCSVSIIVAESTSWASISEAKRRLESRFSPKNPLI